MSVRFYKLKGKPKTKPVYDKNKQLVGYKVKIRSVAPWAKKVIRFIAKYSAILSGLVTLIWLAYGVYEGLLPEWSLALVPVSIALGYGLPYALFSWFLSWGKNVEITKDKIRITTPFFFWLSHEQDRSIKCEFVLDNHPKASEEEKKNEAKERKWASKGNHAAAPLYYKDAQILTVSLLGQIVQLASIYSEKEATKIHKRLVEVDDLVAGSGQSASQYRMNPKDDWQLDTGRFDQAVH